MKRLSIALLAAMAVACGSPSERPSTPADNAVPPAPTPPAATPPAATPPPAETAPPAADAGLSPKPISPPTSGRVVVAQSLASWAVPVTRAELACTEDADCVTVRRPDCCGCRAGGVAGSVNREHLPVVQARLAAACGVTRCVAVMSSHPTCLGALPACVDGSCKLARR